MQVSELQYLLDYNIWADERVLNAARNLSAEQLHAPQKIGVGSAFDILAHVMSAQNMWIMRWQGTSPTVLASAKEYADLDHLRTAWDEVHTHYKTFIVGLDDRRLNNTVSYKNTKGEAFTDPLLWMILHVFNHSTEHRSQVVAICNMAGIDTGPLDLIHYMRAVARPKS